MADLDGYEARLLLYCETCSVDYDGRMDGRHLNREDSDKLAAWNQAGFVASGRVAFAFITSGHGVRTRWCRLSEEAWIEAHRQRRLRAERMWKNRRWETTAEAREEVQDEG